MRCPKEMRAKTDRVRDGCMQRVLNLRSFLSYLPHLLGEPTRFSPVLDQNPDVLRCRSSPSSRRRLFIVRGPLLLRVHLFRSLHSLHVLRDALYSNASPSFFCFLRLSRSPAEHTYVSVSSSYINSERSKMPARRPVPFCPMLKSGMCPRTPRSPSLRKLSTLPYFESAATTSALWRVFPLCSST